VTGIQRLKHQVLNAVAESPDVLATDVLHVPAVVLWSLDCRAQLATRLKVKARHKDVEIGAVPDRGGRTNTYSFEQRVVTDVGRANAELRSKHGQGPAQQSQRGHNVMRPRDRQPRPSYGHQSYNYQPQHERRDSRYQPHSGHCDRNRGPYTSQDRYAHRSGRDQDRYYRR